MSNVTPSKYNIEQLENKKLGELIKRQRKRKKYTQEKIAEIIGISDKHYSKIEIGKYIPSLQTFFKLLDVLELELGDFSAEKMTQRAKEKDIVEQLKNASDDQLELCSKLINVILNK